MKKKQEWLLLALLLAFYPLLIGAGMDETAAKYIIRSQLKYPIRVGVVIFADSRPDEEVSLKVRKTKYEKGEPEYYTTDGYSAEKIMTRKISYQIYKDLQLAEVFNDVLFLKEYTTDKIKKEGISKNLKNRVDAILIGNITHFYGYSDALIEGTGGGILGYMITEATRKPVEYSFEGYTQLVNIELIDTKNSNFLWKGNIEEKIEGKNLIEKKPMTKMDVALRSFHGAINKLVKNLEKVNISR